jgi:hypothetical protein
VSRVFLSAALNNGWMDDSLMSYDDTLIMMVFLIVVYAYRYVWLLDDVKSVIHFAPNLVYSEFRNGNAVVYSSADSFYNH